MRKCLRCQTEMVENLEVKVSNGGYGIDVREKGLFKNAIEKIKCAVCPEGGYTETYIENPDKIKEVIKKEVKLSTNPSENNNSTELKKDINYSENNCVTLVGKVIGEKRFSHKIYGIEFYTFNLSVPRLTGSVDIIPIMISEILIKDKMLLSYGRKLLIKGRFITYCNYEKVEDEGYKPLTIVSAKEIEDYQEDEIINEVILIGKVIKRPIYRHTPFGRDITDLLLAVNRGYNKSDYISARAFGKNAIFSQNLEVGTQVRIVGSVQPRVYEKGYEDGTSEKKVAYEVSISSLEVIDRKLTEIHNMKKERLITILRLEKFLR